MELFEAVRKTKYTRIPETANTLHRLQTKLSDKNRDFCLISVNLLTEVGDCIVVTRMMKRDIEKETTTYTYTYAYVYYIYRKSLK